MTTIDKTNRRTFIAVGGAALLATPALAGPPAADVGAFWADWVAFWNGNLSLADKLIAPGIVVHTVFLDGTAPSDVNGPQPFAAWVGSLSAAFQHFAFETLVGPIAEDRGEAEGILVVGHWRASGDYAGGFPGASAEPGTHVSFTGTDIVRVKDGKVVEYWLVSDTLSLMMALGVKG